MNTTFYILFSIKTGKGLDSYGHFYIGNNRDAAYQLFASLKGNDEVDENNVLCMELMETVDNLPLNVKMKSCTLQELGENCASITKELFKWSTYDEAQ